MSSAGALAKYSMAQQLSLCRAIAMPRAVHTFLVVTANMSSHLVLPVISGTSHLFIHYVGLEHLSLLLIKTEIVPLKADMGLTFVSNECLCRQ